MENNSNYLIEYATKELELIGFDKCGLGETIITFLEQSSTICSNDLASMKQLASMFDRLIDKLPLSPITEDDFYDEVYEEQNNAVTFKRTKRYPHIYQDTDGKYYDDRAYAFRLPGANLNDKIYMYQNGFNSKQEITLPYFPNEQIIDLPKDYTSIKQVYTRDPEPDYEVE